MPDIGSYGPPYTLTLDISSPFTLSSPDTSLSLSNIFRNSSGSTATLMFTTADGFEYPLRSVSPSDGFDLGHPGRIWTNQSTSSHGIVPITLPARLRIETDVVNGSRVWVDDTFAGRFEVFVFGGRNSLTLQAGVQLGSSQYGEGRYAGSSANLIRSDAQSSSSVLNARPKYQ